MKIITEIKDIKALITDLLTNYPHLRDNDSKLIANVYYKQLNDKSITAKDFLKFMSNGDLVNPESVRRCRQLIQEKNQELRGEKYNKRFSESQEFRSKIKGV
jgi:hypothetical protein